MGVMMHIWLTILFLLSSVSSLLFVNSSSSTSLSVGFYDESCPQVEGVVLNELMKKLSPVAHNITIPGTLRLFFHDCYVQGCDGSVLISPTQDNNSERNATINKSLAADAFDVVDKAKAALEEECPGLVSCADILAILARDVVVRWGGPSWFVEKGRRDGRISKGEEAELILPRSHHNISTLIKGFQAIGLSTSDLITLSGAHTIGFTHCTEFASRIPKINSTIRNKIKSRCHFPNIGDSNFAPLDQNSPIKFDNSYYGGLTEGKGLLMSDHELAYGENEVARNLVYKYSQDQYLFFEEFRKSMVRLGRVGVKTGTNGEIRRVCTKFN